MQIVNHSNATPSEVFANNDNVPQSKRLKKNNDNVASLDEIKRESGYLKSRAVENIARKLVTEFQAEHSYKYFIKVAYKLPESLIWEIADKAYSPGIEKPVKYFVAVTHREILKRS